MNESDVQNCLFRYFNARKGYKYQICNAFIFGRWECDFFCVANSGFTYEIEIKVSRSDFFADFKKHRKHRALKNKGMKPNGPNKFCYAVPENLIDQTEVPEYAGLIYVFNDRRRKPKFIKRPPALHSIKEDFTQVLLDKYYWAYLRNANQLEAGKSFQFPEPIQRTK